MKPEVHIDEAVFQKIMHWIHKSNHEVSGLGTVKYENGVFTVIDAILLEQENTATTTDINAAAIGKAMYKLRKSEGDLKFWWHSHVDMAVFWSGTDLATIKQLGEHGWFLSTVFNKKEEMRSCLYMAKPIMVFCDELPTSIMSYVQDAEIEKALSAAGLKPKKDKISEIRDLLDLDVSEKQIKDWDAQYEENVKSKYSYYSSSFNSSYDSNRSLPPYIRNLTGLGDDDDNDESIIYNRSKYSDKEAFPSWEGKTHSLKQSDLEGIGSGDLEIEGLAKAASGSGDSKISMKEVEDAIKEIEALKVAYPHISDEEIVQLFADTVPTIRKILNYMKEQ